MSEQDRPIMCMFDVATGLQTERPFTDEEWDNHKADMAESVILQAAHEKEQAQLEAEKSAGQEKLKALGLTDEEIAALVG